MGNFVIACKAKGSLIGATAVTGTREDAMFKALDMFREAGGTVWDVNSSQKVPIEQFVICEVALTLVPEVKLVPESQPA